jgi:threonine dehydrogenase-like Zn-dependent dehydrogenase
LGVARAAVVTAPRRTTLVDVDRRPPGPHDVRVALEGCGVCGSNLPVWEGRPWFGYPLEPGAPGHESWGRIEAVGEWVDRVRVGMRVAVLSEQAFAESVTVPAEDVIPLPTSLDAQPFPGEALGCGVNVARRSGIVSGDTVAVVGAGFIGAVVTALAASAGARVIAISRRPFALEIATEMGAKETIAGVDRADIVREVQELTDGGLCDVVVEAVGLQEPLDLAGELTREGGRLVIAGFHQDGPRTVDLQLWNWRGIDVVNAHERDREVVRDGIRAAAAAVDAGVLDPRPLYTHREPLDRIDVAMDALVDRPDGFLKALVLM